MSEVNEKRVAVLTTHAGEPLIIRSNPSVEDVRGFVKEHLRRYYAGEPGGPNGVPSVKVLGARYYTDESSFRTDAEEFEEEIDISDLDPLATP